MAAQLILARHAIAITIHLDARAAGQEEAGLGTRVHLRTAGAAVAAEARGGRWRTGGDQAGLGQRSPTGGGRGRPRGAAPLLPGGEFLPRRATAGPLGRAGALLEGDRALDGAP